MANDVYVKNRWMIGGVLAKPLKKRVFDDQDEEDSEVQYKKPMGNSKQTNPALI